MNKKEIIDSIVNLASRILPKGAKLILFGSRARGNETIDSDWDIMILIDKKKRTIQDIDDYGYPFRELGWELNADINPIISTFKEMQTKKNFIPLYNNVSNEGITLWE